MSAKLHFRERINNQTMLFPQRIDKDIAENDPVRLVNADVDNLHVVAFGDGGHNIIRWIQNA